MEPLLPWAAGEDDGQGCNIWAEVISHISQAERETPPLVARIGGGVCAEGEGRTNPVMKRFCAGTA